MKAIKITFFLALGATGCSMTPEVPPFTASSPVSAEAQEGHVDVSTISLIEKESNNGKSDDDALSSSHEGMNHGKSSMGGMDHSNMKMEE